MIAMQADVETKNTQLQQQDGQIQQQCTELQEKATQISRQQRELQTLTVRNWRKIYVHCCHKAPIICMLFT